MKIKKWHTVLAVIFLMICATLIIFHLRKETSRISGLTPSFQESQKMESSETKINDNAYPPMDNHSQSATETQAIQMDQESMLKKAEMAARQHLSIPKNIKPTISVDKNRMTVRWPIPHDPATGPQRPGPDYFAEVIIDISTGEILSLLGGS